MLDGGYRWINNSIEDCLNMNNENNGVGRGKKGEKEKMPEEIIATGHATCSHFSLNCPSIHAAARAFFFFLAL